MIARRTLRALFSLPRRARRRFRRMREDVTEYVLSLVPLGDARRFTPAFVRVPVRRSSARGPVRLC
jgi:hypothetical protein